MDKYVPEPGARVGWLGGSFDPPHRGHLYIAAEVRDRLHLAHVYFAPARQNPHKTDDATPAPVRARMAEAAAASIQRASVCRTELHRRPPSYTVTTLAAMCDAHPNVTGVLILGADTWHDFARWREPLRILQLVEIAVVARPGSSLRIEQVLAGLDPRRRFCYDWKQYDDHAYVDVFGFDRQARLGRVYCLKLPSPNISSTEIRRRFAEGRSVDDVLPATVSDIVEEQGLYGIQCP